MTVTTTNVNTSYTATSGQTTFIYTYQVLTNSDGTIVTGTTEVYINNVLQATNTYVDTPNSNQQTAPGGSIVFNTGLTGGQNVNLVRNTMPYDQLLSFPLEAAISTPSLETAYDRDCLEIQEINYQQSLSPSWLESPVAGSIPVTNTDDDGWTWIEPVATGYVLTDNGPGAVPSMQFNVGQQGPVGPPGPQGPPGTGNIAPGTTGQIAYYASSGQGVSPEVNAVLSGGALLLGNNGTAAGELNLMGATSGSCTVQTPNVAGTGTFFILPPDNGFTGQALLNYNGVGATYWGDVWSIGDMKLYSPLAAGTNTISLPWALCDGGVHNGVQTPNMIGVYPMGAQPTGSTQPKATGGYGGASGPTVDTQVGSATSSTSIGGAPSLTGVIGGGTIPVSQTSTTATVYNSLNNGSLDVTAGTLSVGAIDVEPVAYAAVWVMYVGY